MLSTETEQVDSQSLEAAITISSSLSALVGWALFYVQSSQKAQLGPIVYPIRMQLSGALKNHAHSPITISVDLVVSEQEGFVYSNANILPAKKTSTAFGPRNNWKLEHNLKKL